MTYYYEIIGGSILGKEPGYYFYTGISPAQGGFMNHLIHDNIYKHSNRVWLENANGIRLVKAPHDDESFGIVSDEAEFILVKLTATDITA